MNTLSTFSDMQLSFCINFKYKNGGEIPRRSVDQGLATSPKSTTVDLYSVVIIRKIFRDVNYQAIVTATSFVGAIIAFGVGDFNPAKKSLCKMYIQVGGKVAKKSFSEVDSAIPEF